MKHFNILLLSLASSFSAFATDLTVSSGELGGKLAEVKEEALKLTGTIDARDLAAIENLPSQVKTLDLSGVSIEAITMPDRRIFGKTLFLSNEIPSYTFFKSGVESLILPRDVRSVGEGSFAGSSIREIEIPEGVEALGDYAFYGCRDLTSVKLPKSLKTIGKGAFGNCTALTTIDLSATGISELPERAFSGAVNLADVTLPSNLLKVGREAFLGTMISSLDMSKVTEFEAYALSGMPFLTSITINPDASISDGLLMDNISLASLSGMPENVPDYFAANSGVDPQQVIGATMTIGKYAFARTATESATLILPAGISRIERGALYGLTGVERIDVTALGGDVPEVNEYTFEGITQPEIELYVDDLYFDNWETHPIWRLFKVKSENQTGIDKPEMAGDSGIRIVPSVSMITVEAQAPISDVRIYTADGRVAFISSPGENRVDIPADSLPKGVLVVTASDEDGNSRTVSVLLK